MVDRIGNVFALDNGTATIYKFSPSGVRSTFASSLSNNAHALAFDSSGNLYVSDGGTGTIYEYAPDGSRTTFASGLNNPAGMVFDPVGNLYIANAGDNAISKISPSGSASTFAIGLNSPLYLAFDSSGNLFESDNASGVNGAGSINKFTPNGVQSVFASGLDSPYGLTFGSNGNLYEIDRNSGIIYEFAPNGTKSVFFKGAPFSGFFITFATISPLVNVSAASSSITILTPESIATSYGPNLATGTVSPGPGPLPTSLGGTTVSVHDASGADRLAPLFYVSPMQVNYLVPEGTTTGFGTVTVTAGDGATITANVQIGKIAPGIFTINSSGLVAADVVRVLGNGTQANELVYQFDRSGAVVARPIDLGPDTDQVYLSIYGTGLRAAGTAGITATIGGINSPVSFAGAQGYFLGLDQVNVLIPRALAGSGDVLLEITALGVTANATRLTIQ